ncbi:hypothetical protein ACK3TF_003112 [Chlorella vulgaris]
MVAPGKPRSSLLRMRVAATLIACAAAVSWTLMQVHESGHTLHSSSSSSSSSNSNSSSSSSKSSGSSSSLARIGWYGHDFSARPVSGLTLQEARHICSDNSGNLVWAYGAWHLVDPDLAEMLHLRPPYTDPIDVLLLPTANILVNESSYAVGGKGYTTQVLAMVRAVKVPILTIGLGSQIRFDDVPSAASAAEEEQAGEQAGQQGEATNGTLAVRQQEAHQGGSDYSAASAVQLHPQQVALLQRVEATGGLTVTRGRFTAAIMEANGLAPPLPLGCPSLFINHNPQLGAVLQQKWRAVLRKRDPNLRLGVTLPKVHMDRPFPSDLVRLLAERVLKVFPRSVVVLQTLGDLNLLKTMHDKHGLYLQPDRVRHYYDVEAWTAGLKACCDLVWGFRIHGTMAAIAAEVPGIVVSKDYRIKELAEAMTLPTMDILQAKLDPDTFDLFDFLDATDGMDGRRFDRRRREVAQVYVKEFERLHVPLHPGIAALADSP